jgi:hypothetical protein
MRRKGQGEERAEFRDDRVDDLKELARKCARWVLDNTTALTEADPEMPKELGNRIRDNYRMLVAIADRAGERWAEVARESIAALTAGRNDVSPAEMLLADIQGIFQGLQDSKICSAELVNILAQMEHRPWGGLTQHALAKHLEPFEIAPKAMRINGGKPSRGYEVRWFADAFSRYVRAASKSEEVVRVEKVKKPDTETPRQRNKRNKDGKVMLIGYACASAFIPASR